MDIFMMFILLYCL